ncbi:hypothetical protein HN865_01605 [Candidatus Woesearchaeota archaeon]|jgi:hypothetical protein|nr:hypothetical protein [Candidatus Woesearchaeota archaeon]MBT7237532.1 hypothetical protein [Candidatus Woesearchaeota archaeon]
MKWVILFILLFMVNFVSGAYPEDYSFDVRNDDPVWNWIERDGAPGFVYPVTTNSQLYYGGSWMTLYSHLLDGSVEFNLSDVSTENFILSSGPVNWYPAIEDVYTDGNPSTNLNARIRLNFLDEFGGTLQFHDANTQPSDPDIAFISSGCNYRSDTISPYYSLSLDDGDFDETCEFQILDPVFKASVKSIRVTYYFDLSLTSSAIPYFDPIIEGPIESYFVEICDSFPLNDEDRDGYYDCLDPDCNGQIPGGSVDPAVCEEDHILYDGGPFALTWGGLNWVNTEAYGCTGISGGASGYCCPLWWSWDSGLGRCVSAETCDNGIDDDFDGDIDCEDSDCVNFDDCKENYNGQCGDGVDNDLDGFVDCEDSDCTLVGVQDWGLIMGDYACNYATQNEIICGPAGCNGFHCDQDTLNFCCPITQDLDFNLTPATVECVGPLPALGTCGDGNIDVPNNVGVDELCDGSNLDGNDCTNFGFVNSVGLSCLSDCSDFDTSSCTNITIITPPVGPNEYLVYDDCADDGNGDQYGTTNWILYSGDGIVLDSSNSLCVLYNSNVPFVGLYSILLFFVVIFGFYFRERYLNDN